ncbi:MAG: hypothetical protein MMC23_007225 [Stictis urceolatum]|nr:hypothetical protein [Stictis urceolata]
MNVVSHGERIKAALWAITVLPAIFMGLRLYCKGHFKASVGWDDLVLIFAWILLASYTVIIDVAVDLGIGKHLLDIDPAHVVDALRLVYVGEFIIIIGCSLSKTSFAITLLRTVTQTWQKVLVWWIIVSMNTLMFLCAILYFAQCTPVSRLWDFSITEYSCWKPDVMTKFAMVAGGYSAAMDFILAMLPWTFLMKLQMKKREKFGIAIAMSLGVFAGITAIVKTTYIPNIALQQDFTFYCADLLIWAGTETGITIVAASIPFLRPLVRVVSSYGRSDTESSALNSKSKGHARKRSSIFGTSKNKTEGFQKFGDDLEMARWGHNANGSVGGVSFDSDKALNGIQQTNEITVTYQQREDL